MTWTKRYVNGALHSEDRPSVESRYGHKAWHMNGKRHRVDGPAIEWADGTKEWYQNDKRHRIGGPAIERPDGSKEWYLKGKLHREDGPAIENADGTFGWYLDSMKLRVRTLLGLIKKVKRKSYKSLSLNEIRTPHRSRDHRGGTGDLSLILRRR